MALAFIFPGQGSQSVGMLSGWESDSVVKSTMEEASEAISLDLVKLIQEGPEEELNLTTNAQPALLATSVAFWRVWQDRNGAAPEYMAGHSLGEYSALVAAEAMSLVDGVKLVQARGRIMQAAIPEGVGAMAAVLGLAPDVLEKACEQARQDQVLEAVNFNAPGQIVIAGNKEAVDRAVETCSDAGASRVIPLSVSVPSHSSLMKEASEQLAEVLEGIELSMPKVPVCHNVDASFSADIDTIRALLVKQLWQPVQWVSCYEALQAQGVDAMVECGPSKVLMGLSRRIARRLSVGNLSTPDLLEKALETNA